MNSEDLYQILNVQKSATNEEIKKSYRKLARELHPDKNKGNKQAEEEFKKVSAAYAVLSDKKKRKLYDEYGVDGLRDGFDPNMWKQYGGGRGWPGGGVHNYGGATEFDFGGFTGFGSLEDIFENLFGGGRRPGGPVPGGRGTGAPSHSWDMGRGGSDVKSVLEVELMDVVLGRELQIVVPVNGQRKNLKVKIPKGIEVGQTIRLKGQGEMGLGGGRRGDLLLEIQIKKDPIYQREGMNLIKKQSVTIGEAYFGRDVSVDTPWGSIKMKIPKGAQGGQKLRIKEKGIQKGSKKGDLFIVLSIKIPQRRDSETKKAIEQIEKMYE